MRIKIETWTLELTPMEYANIQVALDFCAKRLSDAESGNLSKQMKDSLSTALELQKKAAKYVLKEE